MTEIDLRFNLEFIKVAQVYVFGKIKIRFSNRKFSKYRKIALKMHLKIVS